MRAIVARSAIHEVFPCVENTRLSVRKRTPLAAARGQVSAVVAHSFVVTGVCFHAPCVLRVGEVAFETRNCRMRSSVLIAETVDVAVSRKGNRRS